MLTFADFEPGATLGERTVTFDDTLLRPWLTLFPDDAEHAPLMPPGMAMVMIMRAYLAVVTPRPPGNIHASQWIRGHARPRLGDEITTEVACTEKTHRNERRWLTLSTRSRDGAGALLFEGRKTLIWAA